MSNKATDAEIAQMFQDHAQQAAVRWVEAAIATLHRQAEELARYRDRINEGKGDGAEHLSSAVNSLNNLHGNLHLANAVTAASECAAARVRVRLANKEGK